MTILYVKTFDNTKLHVKYLNKPICSKLGINKKYMFAPQKNVFLLHKDHNFAPQKWANIIRNLILYHTIGNSNSVRRLFKFICAEFTDTDSIIWPDMADTCQNDMTISYFSSNMSRHEQSFLINSCFYNRKYTKLHY